MNHRFHSHLIACVTGCLVGVAGGAALGQSPAVASTVEVDPAQPGATISPLLYGQFIEHLGRCIHDGIWAEKLRDRKFLLEPGKSWEVLTPAGSEGAVTLEKAAAYAGERGLSMVWRSGAQPVGVRQGGLGLVAGKDYVGYAVLANASNVPSAQLTLAWGDLPDQRQTLALSGLTESYRKLHFRFTAPATTEKASLSLSLSQPGCLWVGCLSLMPADNIQGMRADVLPLIRQLNPPVMRWPGGNFVSGYQWRDGIGDRDRRPPRWERAWNDVEDNDFGLHEFMAFCELVQTEPYIAVNAGLGTAQEAAEEVEYVNGSPSTRWGSERAKNGRRAPWKVSWWGVGNEMYGDWQLGHTAVERYAQRHNEYVQAMRAVDPTVQIIAVGAPGRWNDAFLPACAPNLDLLSGHHYTERKFKAPFSDADAAAYVQNFPAYSRSVADGVRNLVTDFRQRWGKGNPAIDRVRLAIDEWGIVRDWKPSPDGPGVGSFEHYYPLGDALATARAMHEILRNADAIAMANWAQTVNVIGAIKATRNHAVLDPVGHVLALYRARVGGRLVPARVQGNAPLDVLASLDPERRTLTLAVINVSADAEIELSVRRAKSGSWPSATGWRVQGPSLTSINIPGEPEQVVTTPFPKKTDLDRPVTVPPHSVTIWQMKGVK